MSMTGLDAAVRMLDLCESVGTDRYYVTKTDLLENKTRAWPTTAERLHQTLPAVLRAAAVRKPCRLAEGQIIMAGENVIIRPMSRTSEFIQLDDLSAGALERVQPMAFLTLATSPGNHQVWIAVADLSQTPKDQVKDFVRRVKKGVGTNRHAAPYGSPEPRISRSSIIRISREWRLWRACLGVS